jgi:tRNA U38,U39,U40 pseudouridine synthase TruA
VIGVEGRGFLWNMVRIMVGTLAHVGLGKHPPEAIREMLLAKDRTAAGPTAPAHGLYLQWIKFKPLEQIIADAQAERMFAAERAAERAARAEAAAAAGVMAPAAAPEMIVDDADGDPDADA